MLADRLSKAWDARRGSTPIDRVMRFSNEGLVLGAGTILAASRGSARDISIDPLGPRLSALLAAAHLRNPVFSDLAHLRKAADLWSQGDDALASMHLALSRFERLRQPEADAHRLFLADGLLKSGVPSDDIIHAIEMGPAAFERLYKYSADQPRVPAGSGRPSGQWTSGSASGSSSAQDAGSASGASGDASGANGRTGDALQPGLGPTEGEVNPDTITPAGGFIRGDDACHLAMKDCMRNHGEDSLAANENLSSVALKACSTSELACDYAAFVVENTPRLRAWFVFPDGGVVHMLGGYEMIYTPTTRMGRNRFR